ETDRILNPGTNTHIRRNARWVYSSRRQRIRRGNGWISQIETKRRATGKINDVRGLVIDNPAGVGAEQRDLLILHGVDHESLTRADHSAIYQDGNILRHSRRILGLDVLVGGIMFPWIVERQDLSRVGAHPLYKISRHPTLLLHLFKVKNVIRR